MKKNFKNFTTIFLIITIFISLFIKSNTLKSSVIFSINLFIKNIFPSLFPCFLINSLLISIGIPLFLKDLFNNIFARLFKVNGISSFVFISSFLSGFPSSSKYIKDLLDKGLININEANKILLETFFPNPLFIINTVGIMFLNSKKIGFFILLSQIISNIIIGILVRNLYDTKVNFNKFNLKKSLKTLNDTLNNTNIIKEFLSNITPCILTLLNVFATITFFIILINLYSVSNTPLSAFIKGLIESTTGLKYLSLLNINYNIKVYLITFILSFGSLSIHSQIFNILNEYKVLYYPFFIVRIIHASLATLFMFLVMN